MGDIYIYISAILNIYPNIFLMLLYDFPFAHHSPPPCRNGAETECSNLEAPPVPTCAPATEALLCFPAEHPLYAVRKLKLAEWPNSSSGSSSLRLKSQSTTTHLPPHSSGHCHLQGVLNPKAPRWSVIHRIALPERILLQVEDAQWFVVELLAMIIRCNDYKLGYPRLQTNPC